MIILSDLDGVGAEWDGGFDKHAVAEAYAHLQIPLRHERKLFSFYDEVEPEVREAILEIMNHPTLYADLEPVPGWAEAMQELDSMGHTVYIVTTPWWPNPDCTRDKLNWVADLLGEEWRKRVILTGDKTIISGHYLIDDKPEIKGALNPTWEHILFDQPYNSHLTDQSRILNWTDGSWRTPLGLVPVAS